MGLSIPRAAPKSARNAAKRAKATQFSTKQCLIYDYKFFEIQLSLSWFSCLFLRGYLELFKKQGGI